jgi:L-malate glycosyltransferase
MPMNYDGTSSMRTVPVIAEGLFTFQIGGSERVGADLAVEFKHRGYQVVCFAFHDADGPMRTLLEESGIRCLDMNYDSFRGVWRRALYLWKFWRMLRKERITTLHVHHTGALILCGIPARLARVRIVMTEHALQWRARGPLYHKLALRYCRYADEITVVEPALSDYFRNELAVSAEKLHYVANGVRLGDRSPERVTHMRQELDIAPGVFAFFYVGRLEPVKDLGTLLKAFAALPADVLSRARLYFVGDGSERAMLEAGRDSLGLRDKATFLGVRTDVADVLMAADALVMSSISEGLPMVLLEAMAAGVPCIATAVGGIPKLFGDDRGLSVPAQDADKLAEAMASVARSPQLRQRLVSNAWKNLHRHYALDAVVDRYLQLLGLPPTVAEPSTRS